MDFKFTIKPKPTDRRTSVTQRARRTSQQVSQQPRPRLAIPHPKVPPNEYYRLIPPPKNQDANSNEFELERLDKLVYYCAQKGMHAAGKPASETDSDYVQGE